MVYLVATIYFFILVVRILYSLVNAFVRDWRPRGLNLIIAELVMTLTDPPLRFFRRFIPPLRLGQVSLDLSDRKSTRLNSSHVAISYAVFCLKKKKRITQHHTVEH